MSEPRLTPQQRIRASVAVLCDGVDQHVVANIFGVNPGRIAEAVIAARAAFGFPDKKRAVTLKAVA